MENDYNIKFLGEGIKQLPKNLQSLKLQLCRNNYMGKA